MVKIDQALRIADITKEEYTEWCICSYLDPSKKTSAKRFFELLRKNKITRDHITKKLINKQDR